MGHPLNYNFVCSLLPMLKTLICHLVDWKPSDIEGITDIFFEDFKNFPQTRELGEESAQFCQGGDGEDLGGLQTSSPGRGRGPTMDSRSKLFLIFPNLSHVYCQHLCLLSFLLPYCYSFIFCRHYGYSDWQRN